MPRMRRGLLGSLLVIALSSLWAEDLPKPLVVVLMGPPVSGKTTQANNVSKRYGLPVVSAEEIRKAPGATDSQKALNTVRRISYRKGFVLDGYPGTRAEADSIAGLTQELKLPPPIIIQIDVPDDVARQWNARQARQHPNFEADLRRYHEELDLVRSYYPQADIWTILGKDVPSEVFETIKALIRSRMEESK